MTRITPQVLGHTVRLFRGRRHLTQRELGALVGLKPQHISEIELGRVGNPSLRTLEAIAGALGSELSEFVAEIERQCESQRRAIDLRETGK